MDDESGIRTFEKQSIAIEMDFLEYKGYKGSVEYSLQDDCLHGKVQGIRKTLILYEGLSLEELRRDFQEGVDSYLEACRADGRNATAGTLLLHLEHNVVEVEGHVVGLVLRKVEGNGLHACCTSHIAADGDVAGVVLPLGSEAG